MHLHNHRRHKSLLSDRDLIHSSTAAGPVMSELVLLLPSCLLSSLDQVLVVEPSRGFGRKLQTLPAAVDILDAR